MKYELTKETKTIYGVKLIRIKALKDFGDVKKDTLGGFIEKESNLSQYDTSWVSGKAQVYGNARVYGNVQVFGKTVLKNYDEIKDTNNIINILGFEYPITVTPISINIGCRSYTFDQLDTVFSDVEYEDNEDIERIKMMIEIAIDKIMCKLWEWI